jgi:CheY-like chemotaxis protein
MKARKPLEGTRILVAEDDPILAYDIISIIRNAGADTIGPARTLQEALAMAEEKCLSCGVLDVGLRDEDVFPAAAKLRARGVAIVFYTGYGDAVGLQRDWPEAHVLTKPTPAQLMVRTLATACSARGPRR